MPNHLIHENSPYLLQHADNPVDWFPWGPEALEKARLDDKPIFLSIGYAACHWCHVMAHESFEDVGTAEFMNRFFVNIKVDREERLDLDGIYMQAVVAMTGQGGWPMSVFLTPDGRPFYGGTYFPPVRRYNMPAFQEVLQTIAHLWQDDRASLLESGRQILDAIREQAGMQGFASSQPFQSEILDRAGMTLAQGYDWISGGWGHAPKFPQPMTIEYLLRRSTRGDRLALEIASHALHAMAQGGMYDVVGGGFARYSTDDRWCIPHFEKMLYDNAQLATAYLHAWLVTGDPFFRSVCEETLDFVLRELTHPLGGFYSSLDADSEGQEGKYYAWTLQEIRPALGNDLDVEWVMAAYQVTEAGNFDGHNVLQRALSDEQLGARFGLVTAEVPARLRGLHARLLEARSRRVHPATDDKILTGWNALMLATLAEAGRYLGRDDYRAAAQRNARFVLDTLYRDDRLLRSWRWVPHSNPAQQIGAFREGEGRAQHNAYLEDYAALVLGLLALYQTDSDPQWYAAAVRLAKEMIAHFPDPAGGFFDTRDDHEALLYRPKDLQDNATPSGNALAACALLQLAAYGDIPQAREQAEAMLGSMQDLVARHPTTFAQWLQAADFALGPTHEIAILGDAVHPQTGLFLRVLWSRYRPRQVTAISAYPPTPGSPALLNDRPLKDDLPTAYVCRGFICKQPTNSPEEMEQQFGGDVN